MLRPGIVATRVYGHTSTPCMKSSTPPSPVSFTTWPSFDKKLLIVQLAPLSHLHSTKKIQAAGDRARVYKQGCSRDGSNPVGQGRSGRVGSGKVLYRPDPTRPVRLSKIQAQVADRVVTREDPYMYHFLFFFFPFSLNFYFPA